MITLRIFALGLISGTILAWPAHVRRGVDCQYSTAPDRGTTCESFASSWGMSIEDLMSLNPGISCPDLDNNNEYCVIGSVNDNPPTPSPSPSTPTTAKPSTSAASAIPSKTSTTVTTTAAGNGVSTPQPTQPGMVTNCAKFHYVASGVTCDQITSYQHISFADFLKWNPTIGRDCTSMQAGVNVCVGIIGATATPTNKPTTTTPPGNGIQTPQPTQPGMVTNCAKFHWVAPGVICSQITSYQHISLEDFVKWNSGVGSDCRSMQANVNVCVGLIGGTTTTNPPPTTTTAGNGIQTPQPIQPGMVMNCKKFHWVAKDVTCSQIISYQKITLADFVKWNSGVGSDCRTMWAETNVCVGV